MPYRNQSDGEKTWKGICVLLNPQKESATTESRRMKERNLLFGQFSDWCVHASALFIFHMKCVGSASLSFFLSGLLLFFKDIFWYVFVSKGECQFNWNDIALAALAAEFTVSFSVCVLCVCLFCTSFLKESRSRVNKKMKRRKPYSWSVKTEN